jgi:hypothetical protein
MRAWGLISHTKEGIQSDGVRKETTEEDITAWEERSDRWVKKTT